MEAGSTEVVKVGQAGDDGVYLRAAVIIQYPERPRVPADLSPPYILQRRLRREQENEAARMDGLHREKHQRSQVGTRDGDVFAGDRRGDGVGGGGTGCCQRPVPRSGRGSPGAADVQPSTATSVRFFFLSHYFLHVRKA